MAKVSVITPCYNSRAFIGQAIESVRAQSLGDWEHIVLDDGSTDGSADVVAPYAKEDARLRLVRQPNGGVCNARNNGFAASWSGGKYLLFLDADDCLAPQALEVLCSCLDAQSAAGLAFGDYSCIDHNGKALATPHAPRCVPAALGLGVRRLREDEPCTPFASIFCGAVVLPSFSLLRRSIYEAVRGWDEWLGQHHEELDLFLRMALRSEVHYVPRKLGFYRRHEGQSTEGSAQGAGVASEEEARRAQRFADQARKFDQKWSAGAQSSIAWSGEAGLSSQEQLIVRRARRFAARRVAPLNRMHAARDLWRQGRLYPALRLYTGALARYAGALK